MTSVPPGGPSTINGVLYQMLLTLLKTMNIHASGCIADEQTGQITQATLRIEPRGGGGDLQEIGASRRIIQQLKAKSDGGTWSLTDVAKGVLPDLYLAVDLVTAPDTAYEFVTEGLMGRWAEVYEFFLSLGRRVCPDDDVLVALDDAKALKLGIKRGRNREDKTFWPKESYTERRLFERIVEEVRKRQAVKKEPIETTHRKLWHLLGHFKFVGNQTMKVIQKNVDRHLMQLVDYDFDLDQKRDAMLTALARIATRGSADIENSARFLADHGLSSIKFSAWPLLRERSRIHLDGELKRLGYHADEDVRLVRAHEVARMLASTKPMLAISGDSGQGKSWFLYALAQQFATGQELIILVEAKGNADDDLSEAARICWHEIKNNDETLPLNRIAERLRKVDTNRASQWLYLLVDGVQSPEEAKVLANQPWEKWGVRLMVSCEPEIARVFETAGQGRCAGTISVGDFTPEELHKYLTQSVGVEWPDIPSDVRNTLRRPLLARLYRDVAGRGVWRPSNEYELYQRYWNRLVRDERANAPLNRAHLESLVLSILVSTAYPWTDMQLLRAGLDGQSINILIQDGWLRRTPQGKFEVWHNRLLNWAVAASLVNSIHAGSIKADDFCSHLTELFRETDRYAIRSLGYVLMDACWLLANSAGESNNLLDQVLRTIEDLQWDRTRLLYTKLLPTIGSAIVPALFRRLEAVAMGEDRLLVHTLVDGITTFEAGDVAESAIGLLDGDNPRAQRAAMRILSRRPSAKALDRLWNLHCSGQANPAPYLNSGEDSYFLYNDSFGALRACVKLSPIWLETTILGLERDSRSMPVHDLAYLLANLDDAAEVWRHCKQNLFRLVPTDRERCLASNIYAHGDADEIDWLVERVHREDDLLLGPSALRALIKLDPDLAVRHLHRLPASLLQLTKRWCFEELLAKRPEATNVRIAEILKSRENPYDVALAYYGDENSLTVEILDVLLDHLEIILERELSEPSPPNQCPPYGALMMLSRIAYPDLLHCMRLRRGTTLEEKLTEWLLREKALPNQYGHPARRYGLDVLYRFGGAGFTKVINCYLQSKGPYGRLHGLRLAFKRPDETTIELVRDITMRDELWGDHPFEQSLAIETLVYLDRWYEVVIAVLRWGLAVVERALLLAYAGQDPVEDTAMAPALKALKVEGVVDTGAVIAIGLGGCVDQLEKIRSILRRAASKSELAKACVISLAMLHDSSTEAVAPLIDQLDVEEHRYWAQIGLLRSESETALDALMARLHAKFDVSLAINLLPRPYTRQRAAEMIRAHLRDAPDDRLEDLLPRFLMLEDEFLMPILEDSRIREFLREASFADEGSSWVVGSKEMAIRGLSKFDLDAAFLAARTALRNPDSHDRARYPDLLVEIDVERATGELLECVLVEKDPVLLKSMGRALRAGDLSGTLFDWARSAEVDRRLAVCYLAVTMGRGSEAVSATLRRMIEDPDEHVAQSAWDSLRKQRDARAAESLLTAVLSEEDRNLRWILIDALLEIGDPEDEHRPWPEWASAVARDRPYLEQEYIRNRLDERRKSQRRSAELF